jgi:tetratricopeptide (TPR) repeat protein
MSINEKLRSINNYMEKNQKEIALFEFENLIQRYPDSSEQWIDFGVTAMRLQLYDVATEILNEVASHDARAGRVWRNLSDCYADQGCLDKAIGAIIVDIYFYSDLESQLKLAGYYLQKGEFGKVRLLTSDLIEKDPHSVVAWQLKIFSSTYSRDHSLAAEFCYQALKFLNTDVGIRTLLLDSLISLKRYNEALTQIETIKGLGGGDIWMDVRENETRANISNVAQESKHFIDSECSSQKNNGEVIFSDEELHYTDMNRAYSQEKFALCIILAQNLYRRFKPQSCKKISPFTHSLLVSGNLAPGNLQYLREKNLGASSIPKIITYLMRKLPLNLYKSISAMNT